MSERRGFFRSIRFKLLLVSLSLLAIPWAGYRYVQETERFLRQTQETMLLSTAQAVAALLHNSPAMRNSGQPHSGAAGDAAPGEPLQYVNRLERPIQLDGYSEDWLPYLGNLQRYPLNRPETGGWLFESILGEYDGHLYLLIRVRDPRVLFHPPGTDRLDRGDYIDITLEGPDGGLIRYRIASTAPGWVTARRMSDTPDSPVAMGREDRIQGEWQPSEQGYTLELRIPRYLLGERLAIGVADLDDPTRPQSRRLVSTSGDHGHTRPDRLVRPDPAIGRLIGTLEHENARIWVVNDQRLVLARRGRLQAANEVLEGDPPPPFSPLQALMRLILDQPSEHFQDDFTHSARLQGGELDAALAGRPQSRRRDTSDGRAVILSAAWPIQSAGEVAGAVVVEQTTNRILSLQNRALEQITGITLLLFLFIGLAILGFASLLTGRIRRLSRQIEAAVTRDGRIQGQLRVDGSRDEIGDLSRGFAAVLDRLAEYNRYLEEMASRLAHEFRTPLTIVRSSLENLQSDPAEADRERYLERAREGTGRLALILHRMREATRLEQQLLQTELMEFDLADLLKRALEGYQGAFPDARFALDCPAEPVPIRGAPDLISQALDKLISNALDFHQPGTPIQLLLTAAAPGQARLSVRNSGPPLPEGMRQELFASMVSIRGQRTDEPHLGLGLYLVRLIAEFHQGQAEARNLESASGVEFSLLLPTTR